MIQILEVKIDHGRYMILIKIEDDRLRIVDDELVEYIKRYVNKSGTITVDLIMQYQMLYGKIARNVYLNCLRILIPKYLNTVRDVMHIVK